MAERTNITLSQLQLRIKEALSQGLPAGVWVVAEIADIKVNRTSGHCYLELVEKGSDNGVPKAKASAVVWRHTYGMLSSCFSGATGRELAAGMKVLVCASVTYHELYGLSLNITDIDPLYTVGDMERQRQETIARLVEDGVFDLNRELGFPLVPQRIAVVSSSGAAGFQDFMNELAAGGYYFRAELFNTLMQGHGAEVSIIDALSQVADRMEEFDAVAIIRGGGSQSDLAFLNSYLLNFHIAQFPLPVIAGLGHDKDQSIVDMVAAVSLKTPTAVAGFFVERAAALDVKLDDMAVRINSSLSHRINAENMRLTQLSSAMVQCSAEALHRGQMRLSWFESELRRMESGVLMRHSSRLNILDTLMKERVARVLDTASRRLSEAERLIVSHDPQNILARGFAIVRRDGVAINDASLLKEGDRLDITLYKGEIKAEIYGKED